MKQIKQSFNVSMEKTILARENDWFINPIQLTIKNY